MCRNVCLLSLRPTFVTTITNTFVFWYVRFVFVFFCVNYSLPSNGLNWILLSKALHFEVWTRCSHQFIQTIQCTGCNPMGQQYLFAFLQINYSLTFATIQTGCSPSGHLPSNNGSLNFFPASSALSFVPISIIQPCANLQLAIAVENCKSL